MKTNYPYDRASGLSSNLCKALQVATADHETLFQIIMDTFEQRDRLTDTLDEVHKERASDRKALIKALGFLDHHLPMAGLIGRVAECNYYRMERDKAVKTLTLAGYTDQGGELWQPRYIVHGHVQPCVVLYSDETTTLVRIDEGDMMCETDTIQWSDALTYRCQELLAEAGVERGSMAAQRVLPVLVELVRSEHVTLNDEGFAVEQPVAMVDDATSEVARAYLVASAMPFDPYA